MFGKEWSKIGLCTTKIHTHIHIGNREREKIPFYDNYFIFT